MRPCLQRLRGFTIVELIVVIAFLGVAIVVLVPPPQTHGFLERTYEDETGAQTKYVLFVPYEYRGNKPYPLIFFLHGAGDAYRVAGVGLGPAIRKKEKRFPFFVVFPRIRHGWDADSEETGRAMKVLDEVMAGYNIDRNRIYLTGLSNGGTGTWGLAAKYPRRWAAIVPVAGLGLPELAGQIRHLPCWCFHGDFDPGTPVEGARLMIDALRAAGADPRYTELIKYPHNVWDKAYNMPRLYEWLLEQKLP